MPAPRAVEASYSVDLQLEWAFNRTAFEPSPRARLDGIWATPSQIGKRRLHEVLLTSGTLACA